jgi:hypothetical protein
VLAERTHAMPPEARAALAGALGLANIAKARSVAVLFLLDPDSGVRGAVARALAEAPAGLTSADLRRLIAIRNWRPESERADIDAVVRGARGAGIDCARWEGGPPEQIRATCIDGAASQSFVLVSPAGRKKRLSSILTKGGIADAWSSQPETRHRIEATLSTALESTPTFPVSRSYVDQTIAEQLAVTVERGEVPPFGLLEVAEAIGGADWQPAPMDFNQALGALIAEVPVAMREPEAYSSVLRRSDALVDLLGITQSWFEDDPEVRRLMERQGRRNRSKLVAYLLQTVISRRRQRWAEIISRTAVWMHEAPQAEKLCWRELALVAKAIADGRDLSEIGLMRDIAERTIEAFEDGERT